MKNTFFHITFFTLFSLAFTDDLYKLILQSHDRGAACLDGSPPGLYVHEGENKKNLLVFFEGGGSCAEMTVSQTTQSCYKRSFTTLGSTNNWPKQKSFNGKGVLSPNAEENPLFHDWIKAYVIYCDGATHTGARLNPINYKGRDLYFRGQNNTLQHFHYLNKTYDFYNIQKVVISGGSAGGTGTFAWTQYLQDHTKSSKIYSIPDSGLFLLNYESPIYQQAIMRIKVSNLLNVVGTDFQNSYPLPIKKCYLKIKDAVSCFDASNYAQYITAPMLLIQSTYDQWSLQNILGTHCSTNPHAPFSIASCNETEKEAIAGYHTELLKRIEGIRNGRQSVGVWGPACVQHVFISGSSLMKESYKIPSKTGLEINEAIQKFLENPDKAPWLLDTGQWPSANEGCNGLSSYWLRSQ